eukprot:3228604-Pyramimonas_sp.AAC.1
MGTACRCRPHRHRGHGGDGGGDDPPPPDGGGGNDGQGDEPEFEFDPAVLEALWNELGGARADDDPEGGDAEEAFGPVVAGLAGKALRAGVVEDAEHGPEDGGHADLDDLDDAELFARMEKGERAAAGGCGGSADPRSIGGNARKAARVDPSLAHDLFRAEDEALLQGALGDGADDDTDDDDSAPLLDADSVLRL